MNLTERALSLAALGLPVFPCLQNKSPAIPKSAGGNGFHDASTDPATVAAMFETPGTMLIGVPTGAASGFDALDLDYPKGGDKWERGVSLPATRTHKTRSGGTHHLFRHARGLGCSVERIAPGVDVRGDGGYIIFWDERDTFDAAELAEWPAWLLEAALRLPRAMSDTAHIEAPPNAAAVIDLLTRLPNPASNSRDVWTAVMLASTGCVAALESGGQSSDGIAEAACEWAARWPSSPGYDVELSKWEKDWQGRGDKPLAGWRNLRQRAGAEIEGYATEVAALEFGALPPEPEGQWHAPKIHIDFGNTDAEVKDGHLTRMIDAAEAALMDARVGLYQRAGVVVKLGRVDAAVKSMTVTEPHLSELMNGKAKWLRWNNRAKAYAPTLCPSDIPRMYLARGAQGWNLPHLVGIINAPTMRPDGSILDAPGYDLATRLYFDPDGETFPEIPANPSREAALAALATLQSLIAECAFIDKVDEAVALSAILTAMVRTILPSAPAHAFTAPAPGSGKSYLASITARIATGRDAAGLAFSHDEAENRKQIDAVLLEGKTALLFDNVTAEVTGARLSEVLTQEEITVRILGRSETVTVPCAAFILIDGNNLTIAADMTRRVLLSRLDRRVERPELHAFASDPLALIAADRGRYVAAALTVLRAYHVAGRPGRPAPLGSFVAWSGLVRGALLWLGQVDPVGSIEQVRANDPRRSELLTVLDGWGRTIGARRVTAAEVIDAASHDAEFHGALLAVAGVANSVNIQRFGKWLRANADKIAGGACVKADAVTHGKRLWALWGGRAPAVPATADLAAMMGIV